MNRWYTRAFWALLPSTLLLAQPSYGQPVGSPNKPQGQPPTGAGAGAATPPVTQGSGQGTQPTPPGNSAAANTKEPQKNETVDAAHALFKEGKEEEALNKLKEAVTANNNLPPARLMIHRMYLQAGKYPQARAAIEQAAVDTPDHPDVYITLAGYAINELRLTDAILEYEKALSVIQDSKKWNESQQKNVRLTAWSGLARAHEGRGQWELAKKNVEDILKLDFTKAQLAPVRAQLGRIYFMMDKDNTNAQFKEQALKELEQAHADEPSMEPPGVTMGRLYTGKGNAEKDKAKQKPLFDKAKEWYEYAIKKDPKSFKAHMAYAVWLFDMNYLEKSYLALGEDELKEAAKLDPKANDVRVLRGIMYRWAGNFQGAENEFEALVKENPSDAGLVNQLVLSMVEQKDQGKVQRALELSLENYKRNAGRLPEVTATAGWVLFKNNRLDEAEQALRQALTSGQASSDTIFYYAQVQRYRGKLDEAVNALKAAVQSPGRFMYRKEAMRDLEQLMPGRTTGQ
jgi:tetratricopeptide (TPR) repeat protein